MLNKEKIIEISKRLGLTHVGSNLSVLPIFERIYEIKKPEDKVILDNAHAHLAHLVALEDYELKTKSHSEPYESGIALLIKEFGIHCDRDAGCDASGGSLGHGIGIGIGMALTGKTVHVIVSDGSMMEGSNWEALRIKKDLGLDNLKIYANFNGYSAVAKVNTDRLFHRMKTFCSDVKVFYTSNGLGENKVEDHYTKL